MKKLLLIFFFLLWHSVLFAQLPDWTRNKPKSPNPYIDYEVGIGVGNTYPEAEKAAYLDLMKKFMDRCGITLSTDNIIQAIYGDKPYKVGNVDLNKPPFRHVCQTQEILPDKKFRVYLLYQVPRDGSVIDPQLHYVEFNDCEKIGQFSNGKALAASFFIPGSGQMIKRRYTEGSLTLLGELVLVGGGVGTYFVGKKQLNIMKDRAVEYEAFHSAQYTYNTMRIVSYTCYGAAAALYIFNLYRAYTITPRPKRGIAFYPTVIQSDEYNLAMGVGMTIKF